MFKRIEKGEEEEEKRRKLRLSRKNVGLGFIL
jgi:hypothetical protein